MTDSNGNMVMPVAPFYGGNGYGSGNDGLFGGNSGWWIIILLLLFGWNGNNGLGTNSSGSEVQRGFDQNALMNGLAGINSAVANGFSQAEVAANSRQMAAMNQNYALQSALQNCCCENRAATADLKYTVATEACSDRNAVATALRDVLENNNVQTQRILDTLCQDKIDAKNERIADLQQQLTMAQLAASQNAQTSAILANNEAQTAALERYLAPTPIPAYMVQNPNCCAQNFGCGCGNV